MPKDDNADQSGAKTTTGSAFTTAVWIVVVVAAVGIALGAMYFHSAADFVVSPTTGKLELHVNNEAKPLDDLLDEAAKKNASLTYDTLKAWLAKNDQAIVLKTGETDVLKSTVAEKFPDYSLVQNGDWASIKGVLFNYYKESGDQLVEFGKYLIAAQPCDDVPIFITWAHDDSLPPGMCNFMQGDDAMAKHLLGHPHCVLRSHVDTDIEYSLNLNVPASLGDQQVPGIHYIQIREEDLIAIECLKQNIPVPPKNSADYAKLAATIDDHKPLKSFLRFQ